MRRYGVVVSFLLAALLPMAPAAAVDGYANAPNGVLYNEIGCRQIPVSYSITLPPGTTYWNMDLLILGPDGLEAGSGFLSYYLGDAPTGTTDVQVCSDMPGRYTVSASGEYEQGDSTAQYELFPTSFAMRPAKTRTTLTASNLNPSYNDRVTFKVRVKDERPNGFFPTDYVDVVLQRKQGGKWVKAPSGDIFVSDGKGSITYRWDVRAVQKIRALTRADGTLGESISKVLTIR